MITFTSGNLLKSDVEALVNTVNCVGIMGKGIALQMKQAFPDMFKEYVKACDLKIIKLGHMYTYHTGLLYNPKYIINFPTKDHWKSNSKIESIRSGLSSLSDEIKRLKIKSIAVPPLGCGNGGLDWTEIKPLILEEMSKLKDVDVRLYEPKGAPPSKEMPVNTGRPNMTRARALLLRLLELYKVPGYNLTLMEVQKLAYFLQAAGEPLRLDYTKHLFGPYAEKLNFVLQRIEGHFIRGYGDRSKGSAQISLVTEAVEHAHLFIKDHPDDEILFDKIRCLIEGFESPYGLELLSTVHWLIQEDSQLNRDMDKLVQKVGEWNNRKKQIMKPSHVIKAWNQLQHCGWVSADPNLMQCQMSVN